MDEDSFALNVIAERAVANNEKDFLYMQREVYTMIIVIGVVLLIISSAMYSVCLWHSNHSICSRQSEIDLSVTDTTRCHDEEKSNNLQNEENFRRYANPLKNSTCSLRSSSNVELNPIQDHQYVGTSNALNRSQLSILKNPTSDFTTNTIVSSASAAAASAIEYEPSTKGLSTQSLYKTQNFDVDKNTIHGIESQQSSKDFDKCMNKVDFKFFSVAQSMSTPNFAAAVSMNPSTTTSNHHHVSSSSGNGNQRSSPLQHHLHHSINNHHMNGGKLVVNSNSNFSFNNNHSNSNNHHSNAAGVYRPQQVINNVNSNDTLNSLHI